MVSVKESEAKLEKQPANSELVRMEYLHARKDGGPNRSYRDNPQIPVVKRFQVTVRVGGCEVTLQTYHRAAAQLNGEWKSICGYRIPPEKQKRDASAQLRLLMRFAQTDQEIALCSRISEKLAQFSPYLKTVSVGDLLSAEREKEQQKHRTYVRLESQLKKLDHKKCTAADASHLAAEFRALGQYENAQRYEAYADMIAQMLSAAQISEQDAEDPAKLRKAGNLLADVQSREERLGIFTKRGKLPRLTELTERVHTQLRYAQAKHDLQSGAPLSAAELREIQADLKGLDGTDGYDGAAALAKQAKKRLILKYAGIILPVLAVLILIVCAFLFM